MIPTQSQIDKIKFIVCDLDGTLFHKNRSISKNTSELLIDLQKEGYTLVLATGRFFYELDRYIKQLKMDEYGGIVACANGLEIHDLKHNTIHSFSKLDFTFSHTIVEEAKEKGIICYANYDKQYHVYHYLPILFLFNLIKIILFPFKFIIPNQRHIKRLYKLSFHTNIDNNIKELHKLCFLSTPNKLASFTDEITKKYPDYIFYPVNQKATELVHKSVGKYQALSWITKNKGYCLENVMAFGDSGNDQELLTYAGIGVAMKNAILETSKVTPYHTDLDNEEDGVYNYLLKTIKKA